MLKREARNIFREKRTAITITEKTKWDDLLLIEFQKLPLPFLSTVLNFYPVEKNNEPDTFTIASYLQFTNPGLVVAYPKTDFSNHTMQAIICGEDSIFENNSFSIPEPTGSEIIDPEEIDMVLVPLLAFDKNGYRVGYGKGFYDRFLQQCKSDCIKIGLSYFDPVDAIKDANEFDVPLNFCITPQKVYVF